MINKSKDVMETDTSSSYLKTLTKLVSDFCEEIAENIALYLTTFFIILVQYFLDELAVFVGGYCKYFFAAFLIRVVF